MNASTQQREEAKPFRTNNETCVIVPPLEAVPAALVMNLSATPLSIAYALKTRLVQLSTTIGCGDFADTSAFAAVLAQPAEEAELLVDWLTDMLRAQRRSP